MNWSSTLRRWQRERDDRRLFRYLCDLHRLAPRERKLLTALGEQGRVLRESEIFVRPALFARSPEPKTWPHHEVAQLHAKLFGVVHVAAPTASLGHPTGYPQAYPHGYPQPFSPPVGGPQWPGSVSASPAISPASSTSVASAAGPMAEPRPGEVAPAPPLGVSAASPVIPSPTFEAPAPTPVVSPAAAPPEPQPERTRTARWKRPLDLLRRARSRADTSHRDVPPTTPPTSLPTGGATPTSTPPTMSAPRVPGVSFTQVEDPAVPGLPATWGE